MSIATRIRRRSILRLVPLLLLASVPACAGAQNGANGATATAASAADPAVTAFVGVHVVPMDSDRVLRDQTVVVRDGRVTAMGPAATLDVPAGATVVEGRGRYLLPGLAEMHAHIPPSDDRAAIERTLQLYALNGVTTARGMLGHPAHLQAREDARAGRILSPRIFTSGPSFNGNSVTSPAAAVRMVEEQKAAGYDFLKIHPGIGSEAFDSIDAAADRVGIGFAGHVLDAVGLSRSLSAGYASIDHLDGYVQALVPDGAAQGVPGGLFGSNLAGHVDESRIPAVVEATRLARVWNVPTQSLIEHLAGRTPAEELMARPEMRYMPEQTVAQWANAKRQFQSQPGYDQAVADRFIELRRRLIRELHRGGAGLLLGSDAPQIFNVPGFSVQHELEYMVAAGLTPYEALATGTRNPAVFFGEELEWGTIGVGKAADFILVGGNPLEDVRALRDKHGVMVRGHWLPREEIDARLAELAR